MPDTKPINANIDEHAGIAWLTLSRPEKKNALSIALLTELSNLLRSLAENDKIRCIVTTGAGDSYSSGRDLYDMRGQDNRRRTRGFGGVAVAQEFERVLPRGAADVTLISRENFFLFNPMLPEVAGGSIETPA